MLPLTGGASATTKHRSREPCPKPPPGLSANRPPGLPLRPVADYPVDQATSYVEARVFQQGALGSARERRHPCPPQAHCRGDVRRDGGARAYGRQPQLTPSRWLGTQNAGGTTIQLRNLLLVSDTTGTRGRRWRFQGNAGNCTRFDTGRDRRSRARLVFGQRSIWSIVVWRPEARIGRKGGAYERKQTL